MHLLISSQTCGRDSVCVACDSCPVGQYRSGCSQLNSGVCVNCTSCPVGTFCNIRGQCQQCPPCPAGSFCDESGSCAACPAERFASLPNSTSCSRCSACDLNQYEESACNATHDVVCRQCAAGQYFQKEAACTDTKYVNNECADFQHYGALCRASGRVNCKQNYCDIPEVAANCCFCGAGVRVQRGCHTCPDGSFRLNTMGAYSCSECSACPAGMIESSPCTNITNRTCDYGGSSNATR